MTNSLTLDELKERKHKALLLKKNTMVSPKMEQFRGFPCTYMGARGGRGAGAKTRGFVSLMVQEAQIKKHNYVILREVQDSIKNSVYRAIETHVNLFDYKGWEFTNTSIKAPSGSEFIFKGLKDRRSISNTKGLEGFDRVFIEEAAYVSKSSIDIILPTVMRFEDIKVMFAYNPLTEFDPITTEIWNRFKDKTDQALMVEMLPCEQDNPWWPAHLQELSEATRQDDPDGWLHIYGGQPWKQGDHSIISMADVSRAVERKIDPPEGGVQIGVDVARSPQGDETVMYKRHGLSIVERRAWRGQDTMRTAEEAWDMANHDPSVLIVVDDTGVGAGVSDRLIQLGAKVFKFVASAQANDPDKYDNATSEMWFEFPVKEADIFDYPELIRQLTGRQYSFDNKSRRKAESKDLYKKRLGRSPDDADALLLCYYNTQARSTEYVVRYNHG